MEIPGTAALKEARLRLSSEGGKHVYLIEEPGSGRLLRMKPETAHGFWRARKAAKSGNVGAGEASDIAAFSAFFANIRKSAITAGKAFNPLFLNIPLLDVRPMQPALTGIARALFSMPFLVFLMALTLFAVWLSASTGFAFFGRIGDVFSLDAILTFALIAPVLKLFHELGHVLAATRFGVPVRAGGVVLVALYPMPFVDCSEADFRATRMGRIVISLAGLMSDLSLALLAFLIWHFTQDPWLRQLLSNVFVFSTLTTLVFNLNPLMKLDGYFALSDALHRRNWQMESQMSVQALRKALGGFQMRRAGAIIRAHVWHLIYAAASLSYKVYILAFIAWTLLPKYLGLGAVVVGWGAAVMFLTPLLKAPKSGAVGRGFGRWFWLGGIAALCALIALIPLPFRTVVPLTLDLENAYQVRVAAPGTVREVAGAGNVQQGAVLVRMQNIETDVNIALNRTDQAIFAYLQDTVRGDNPLATQSAAEQMEAARAIGADLAQEQESLVLVAAEDGWFRPSASTMPGAMVMTGDAVGIVLPHVEEVSLTGILPEIYAEKFQGSLSGLELRADQRFLTAEDGVTARIELAETEADGVARTFTLLAKAPVAPLSLSGQPLHLKLTFASEPLWRHGVFLFNRLRLNFWQAQELERRRTLE